MSDCQTQLALWALSQQISEGENLESMEVAKYK